MVAGELAGLRCEVDVTVPDEELGFRLSSRVDDDLAGKRVAGSVLVSDAQIEVPEGDPSGLAGPAHVNDLRLQAQQVLLEGGDRLRRHVLMIDGLESVAAGQNLEICHLCLSFLEVLCLRRLRRRGLRSAEPCGSTPSGGSTRSTAGSGCRRLRGPSRPRGAEACGSHRSCAPSRAPRRASRA